MTWASSDLLSDQQLAALRAFFTAHPIEEPPAGEVSLYAGVAAAPDWRQMYAAAADTPVMQFVQGVKVLLADGR